MGRRPITSRKRRDKITPTPKIDAVSEPDQLDFRRGAEKRAEAWQIVRAFHRMRLRLDLLKPHARRGRRDSKEISRAGSENGTRATPRLSASARAIRSSTVRLRMSQVRGCRETIVDQQRQGGFGREVASGGIPQGTRGGDDDKRGQGQTQQRSHHGVRAASPALA